MSVMFLFLRVAYAAGDGNQERQPVPILPVYMVPTLEESPPDDYEHVNPAFNDDVRNYDRLQTAIPQHGQAQPSTSPTHDYENFHSP